MAHGASGDASMPGAKAWSRLDRLDGLWLLVVCSLYGVLTIPRLADRPVWTDEAFTVGATRALGDTLRRTGGTMGLYYLVVTPVARLSDTRFWLRLPSALFVAATIAVVYVIARRIGSRAMAVVASAVLAATWSMARWGVEARGYSLAMLFVAVSWLALISAVLAPPSRARGRWWWAYGVAVVAAPLAHGLAAIQFPVQVAALLLLAPARRWFRPVAPVVGALALEGFILFRLGAGEVASWIPPLAWRDADKLTQAMFGRGASEVVVALLVIVGTGFAVVDGCSVWRARGALVPPPGPTGAPASVPPPASADGRSIESGSVDVEPVAMWLRALPALWLWGLPLLTVAISFVRPYQQGRYLTSSLPAVALVLAGVLVRVRWSAMVGSTVVILALLLANQGAVTTVDIKDWPAVVHQVARIAAPGDLVLSSTTTRAPFDYAYAELHNPPPLAPLSPRDPIGVTRRRYLRSPGTTQEQLLGASPPSVWWVLRERVDGREAAKVLADPSIVARYRVTGRWTYRGDLTLLHLEARTP